ncbi:hypothetical protein OWV82_003978 [Melia azedarach]|uniref:Uncharacterized protein n=1 Tax=Melia azedarach TaxID=155640 RepID=A0ACC1YNP8_MELAZ|nr:hypothetical protein OWV82_003978 [Melia azedarach]
MNHMAIYPPRDDINNMYNTVSAESMIKKPHPYLGPNRSQTTSITKPRKYTPEIEAVTTGETGKLMVRWEKRQKGEEEEGEYKKTKKWRPTEEEEEEAVVGEKDGRLGFYFYFLLYNSFY